MDNNGQIEISYTISKQVSRQAYSYLYDQKVNPKNFIWVAVVMAAYYLYTYYTAGFSNQDFWFFLPLLGLPLGLLITKYYLPRIWGNRMYKQYAGKQIKWIIRAQNIQLWVDNAHKTVSWNYFQKAVFAHGVILMFTQTNVITPIPIDVFNHSNLNLFKLWVEQNLPK